MERLEMIFEGHHLKLGQPQEMNDGFTFYFVVRGVGRSWPFSLSRDALSDLPAMQQYQKSAAALAAGLEMRFKNVSPTLFLSGTPRLLNIEVEWPLQPYLQRAGSCLGVRVQDFYSKEVAHVLLLVTHLQSRFELKEDPFRIHSALVNSVRCGADQGQIAFYPSEDVHPNNLQEIKLDFAAHMPGDLSADQYLREKVFWLGYRADNKDRLVWIADPWDAEYLNTSVAELRQSAEALEAYDYLQLGDDRTFARVGVRLLREKVPLSPSSARSGSTSRGIFKTAFSTYTAGRVLGEGGTGRVYEALDGDGAKWALKCLKPENVTESRCKRFKNEMAFCKENKHPNIIKVDDWGLTEVAGQEVPFYIMPLYPKTLRHLMRDGIDSNVILALFRQILDGIEAAHKQGVWHRDLKPENLLYDPDSRRVVIADFGIAHFAEHLLQTTIQTGPQERLANFQYAAPEQRTRSKVDHRADIYALGLILNEMFTGQLLQGTGHKTIGSIAPAYARIDVAVDRMVRQSPAERPQSIAEVRQLLGDLGS
jgi:hypothetical protein